MIREPLPRLHAITDERIARRADLNDVARELAAGGGADLALHARGHTLSGLESYELANRLSAYPPTRLFVNERLDVALGVEGGAAGVQLRLDGLTPADARRLDPDWWIGVSVHDLEEAAAAQAAGADYLLVGPVYDGHPSGPRSARSSAPGRRRGAGASGHRDWRGDAGPDCPAQGGRCVWGGRDPGPVGRGRSGGRGPAHAAGAERMNDTIDVLVNGERRSVARGATLLDLLRTLELDPRVVVVEHNRAIVRRPKLGDVAVGPGDAIELVHFVGGG